MAAVRRREPAAFETLFNQYNRLVFGIAIKMLGDQVAAEDAVQAVFLKIWHAPELFRGGNFVAWLVRVTRNRCLDQLRSSRTHSALEIAGDMADDASLEDCALERIDAEQVRDALRNLPGEQRDPIRLGFFGGLTHEEISQRTGVPLGTVKTRIRAGLHKLRDHLDGAITR